MIKIIFRYFILLFLIFFSILFLILFIPPGKGISIIEYKSNLLNSTESPKIVIQGGSGAFYGIDSKNIHSKLGYNVVNMAMFVGFGLEYMLEEIKPFIKKDDVVVLILEYVYFLDYDYFSVESIIKLLNRPFNFIYFFRNLEKVDKTIINNHKIMASIQEALLIRIRYLFNIKKERFYHKQVYNDYGDCIYHLNKEKFDNLKESFYLPDKSKFDNNTILALNKFYSCVNNKGAEVYLFYPCLPDYLFNKCYDNFINLDEWLKDNSKIPVITTPQEQVYPKEYFYDTINHLNARGRRIRTEKLIQSLRKIYSKIKKRN
ncbi:MAG: hypothetical protein KAT05_01335 [Spirochaetes bacterium]|nr:hypothetical protein [Spirochaetota bacterium]